MAKFFLVLSIIVMIGTGGCGLVFATGGFADAAFLLAGPPFVVALIIAIVCYRSIVAKNETPSPDQDESN
ncbi:hypothetical protein [Amylibacter sp. IMCC11727]|uniref:hypothetical protein n=1 Tax=Amylibacter sp. IMCC11727 TaxID=3039851 RepID=UPI00244E3F31|nr:hypothetical protein [Amylibacter sp. IMCC11727]WGI20214.1 hypothetical protein QBD29_08750 [Amylibacter sp. IMCC11727]